MPWHVIVFDTNRRQGDPWLLEDRVFRKKEYPDRDSLLRAIGAVCQELEAMYPPPQFQIVSGIGPESSHPGFDSFVTWLLRSE